MNNERMVIDVDGVDVELTPTEARAYVMRCVQLQALGDDAHCAAVSCGRLVVTNRRCREILAQIEAELQASDEV